MSSGLIGIRESDGKVLWRYPVSNIIPSVPHNGANAPGILKQGGALYFGTTAADTSLRLNSLQLATGRLLWSQPISSAGKFVLWDLAVGDSGLYAILVPPWGGMHPSFDGLTLSSIEMRNGALRWQDHPTGEVFPYIADTSGVVLLASATGVAGLSAENGATLWRRSLTTAPIITAANGTAHSLLGRHLRTEYMDRNPVRLAAGDRGDALVRPIRHGTQRGCPWAVNGQNLPRMRDSSEIHSVNEHSLKKRR